jgi:MoxR-like ATPase
MPAFDRYKVTPARAADGSVGGGYIPTGPIAAAVNAALWCGQPLLVTGEPGVGKTDLALSIAWQLDLPEPVVFAVRSDSVGTDAMYEFDHLGRMSDALRQDPKAQDPGHYVRDRALKEAFECGERRVVLIDEVDKAPRDFPNDLLYALDKWRFQVKETRHWVSVEPPNRPFVVVTCNDEQSLPGPFLRRCVYLRIPFPDPETLLRIVDVRTGAAGGRRPGAAPTGSQDAWDVVGQRAEGGATPDLAREATRAFGRLRERYGPWAKAPSIGELLAWVRVLGADPGSAARLAELAARLRGPAPKLEAAALEALRGLFPGVLVKTDEDEVRLGLAGSRAAR